MSFDKKDAKPYRLTMKLIVTGISGRMGGEVARAILASENMDLIAATAHEPYIIGKDVGEAISAQPIGVAVTPLSATVFSNADALIDFTMPEATIEIAEKCGDAGIALVTGTTGLSAAQQAAIISAADKTPIMQSFNMSLGVNLLAALVEQAGAVLDDSFDIEINESHHRYKKDAPSGTAILLGKSAAKARGVNLEDVQAIDRNCERKTGDIGFSVQRGGAVIGDHTVMLMGDNERIELTHKASNRRIYADGALKAAQWLQGKQSGLYSMRDVLGI